MFKTISCQRPRVKPARRTARHHAPFGVGILAFTPHEGRKPYTEADLRWAAEMFADDGPGDDEWDARAAERDAEDRYLASVGAGLTCSVCGMKPEAGDGLTAGLCDQCSAATGGDIDRGHCWACGSTAWLEDDGCCTACSLRLADASHSGNHGY